MFELYFTTAVILFMMIALAKELFNPAGVVFTALLLLISGGVISVDEAFHGFSNKGMLTVGFLFIVSAALQSSGAFAGFISSFLGSKKNSESIRYFRLMLPVAGLSAFLNNTPIVATLIPIVKSWAKKNNLPISKYLIPLSYAAVLGGTTTLIGTSTNLVVHGLLIENKMPGFSFFEITAIGIPIAIFGIVFIALLGKNLLPAREDVITQLGESTREFVVGLKVTENYPHLNKTIKKANLRRLQGLFLFQIERDGKIITPVNPQITIRENDRLFFTGLTSTIFQLQKTKGLQLIKDHEFDLKELDSDKFKTYEAVLSNTSPLIGQTVRGSGFRTHFDAVILAIHRSGERIEKKIGDITLKANDTLFLLARKGFGKRWYHSKNFSLVTSSLDIYSKPKRKGNYALIILSAMVFSAATGLVPIIYAAAVASVLMMLTGVISAEDAKNAVNWDILLLIASSFGIAKGLANSGLATNLGTFLIDNLSFLGPIGIISGIFILTSASTLFITNNAAAAIVFPIALSVVKTNPEIALKPVMLILALGASTCFASPIGYQTNLMVYSAGNYRFKDFFKIGIFMNIFVGITAIGLVYLLFYN